MFKIIVTGFIALFALNINAQYLITSEFLGEETKETLEERFGIDLRNGVKKYKITYMTTGVQGQPDTASGLIVVSTTRLEDQLAVVAYQHGTTNGPDDVPSREMSGSDEALAYGAMGYHVCAADYLGLGDNDGFHPYVHAGTEASAGLDMIIAMSEFVEDETGEPVFDHLFVSGYSQGGHAAMALMQSLEQNWSAIYPMTAATPMSGPYSISEIMYERMIGDEPYFFVSYPIYAMLGMQEVYGNLYDSLEQLFKPAYISSIRAFYNRQVNLAQLTTFVFAQLIADNGLPLTRDLFVDSTLQEIESDPDHPIRIAMRESDTYDWKTNTPTRLLYCTADDQVPFANTILADSVMQERGAADLAIMDMNPDANHSQCAEPAILESIRYFDSFILSTSTQNVRTEEVQFAYPNPVSSILNVQLTVEVGTYRYSLINLSGQIVGAWQEGNQTELDVSQFASGLYILRVDSDNYSASQKIVIN
jgi:type IX secretion system substrate protein